MNQKDDQNEQGNQNEQTTTINQEPTNYNDNQVVHIESIKSEELKYEEIISK